MWGGIVRCGRVCDPRRRRLEIGTQVEDVSDQLAILDDVRREKYVEAEYRYWDTVRRRTTAPKNRRVELVKQ